MPGMSPEDREYLQQTARILVRGRYDPLEYIEESLFEMAGDTEDTLSERDQRIEVRNTLIRAVTELTQEQATWPALTDYDRLKAALDTLETEGIVTRENFTCCGTCGAAEIGAEIEDFAAETGPPRHWLCLLPPAGHGKRRRRPRPPFQLRHRLTRLDGREIPRHRPAPVRRPQIRRPHPGMGRLHRPPRRRLPNLATPLGRPDAEADRAVVFLKNFEKAEQAQKLWLN